MYVFIYIYIYVCVCMYIHTLAARNRYRFSYEAAQICGILRVQAPAHTQRGGPDTNLRAAGGYGALPVAGLRYVQAFAARVFL